MNSTRKLLAVLATAFVIVGVLAASAQACSYPGAKQVFKPWGDQSSYVLGPDGGFEAGASGWSLAGGAGVVAGNESFNLNSPGDSNSLYLPEGSSATSPPVCMSLETPSYRMFVRNSGSPSSTLRVEAIFKFGGLLKTTVVSTVSAGPSWAPAQQMSTVAGLAPAIGTVMPAAIQVRITPVGAGGKWQVDDFYVDPFARH